MYEVLMLPFFIELIKRGVAVWRPFLEIGVFSVR